MENIGYVNKVFLPVIFILVFLSPVLAWGYADETTHPALTKETVELFNSDSSEYDLDEAERDLIMKGSIEEDSNSRWLHHFYDPAYERGLTIGGDFESSKKWSKDVLSQAHVLDKTNVANPFSGLFSSGTDHTWQRAIYEYAWGDKERAMRSLGHILHLAQDATVPAHTRNDPHGGSKITGGESPYENWTSQFEPNKFESSVKSENIQNFNDLRSYFNSATTYSNTNFFSKDTIKSEEYKRPNIKNEKNINSNIFGIGQIGKEKYKLALLRKRVLGRTEKKSTLKDPNFLILKDYWSILSRQAVSHGAGVINLFFERVEEEKKTKELYKKNKSWTDRAYDATVGKVFNLVGDIYGSSVEHEDLHPEENGDGNAQNSQTAAVSNALDNDEANEEENSTTENVAGETDVSENATSDDNIENPEDQQSIEPQSEDTKEKNERSVRQETASEQSASEEQENEDPDSPEEGGSDNNLDSSTTQRVAVPYPGYGAGGGSSSKEENSKASGSDEKRRQELQNEQNSEQDNEEQQNAATSTPEDDTPPATPTISSPKNGAVFATSSVTIAGTAEASSTILLANQNNTIATSSVNSNGQWQKEITPEQGTTTINVAAYGKEGGHSSATSTTFFVDTKAPQITLNSPTCSKGLNSKNDKKCLLKANKEATSTPVKLEWSSESKDLTHFKVSSGNEIATTSSTSTKIFLSGGEKTEFSVVGVDSCGNTATSTINIAVSSRPVVVNEVAWMGNKATSSDEWIELYNNTSQNIDLSGWFIRTRDGSPRIKLGGTTIKANSYYLIERSDDKSVKGVKADKIAAFSGSDKGSYGLNDDGEHLLLQKVYSNSTTTVDEVPLNEGEWYAGDKDGIPVTMERYRPNMASNNENSWGGAIEKMTQDFPKVGGTPIHGTPKDLNSISHKIVNHSIRLNSDKKLSPKYSPYFVSRSGLNIEKGAELKIPAGVTVKMVSAGEPRIKVSGKLIAEGAKNEPVVITSFKDDEYGGDMNGDGFCEPDNISSNAVCPNAGEWDNIKVGKGGELNLKHTQIKYGGNSSTDSKGMILVEEGDALIEDSQVQYSKEVGAKITNSKATIKRSEFSENEESGILIEGGAPTVKENTMEKNEYGLRVENALNADIVDNDLKENTRAAMVVSGLTPYISGNRGQGNGQNAIRLSSIDFSKSATLAGNPLSYKLSNDLKITDGAKLVLEGGVVFKAGRNEGIEVENEGVLLCQGLSPGDVVMTSVRDDSVGSNINGASTTPSAGDWEGVTVLNGGKINMSGFVLRYAGEEDYQWDMNRNNGIGVKFASTSTISNARITDNMETGIYIEDSALHIATSTFARNGVDIDGDNGNAVVTCQNCGNPTTTPEGLLGE